MPTKKRKIPHPLVRDIAKALDAAKTAHIANNRLENENVKLRREVAALKKAKAK